MSSNKIPIKPNTSPEIAIKIQEIFDTNELNELEEFMKKRKCLNQSNVVLSYFFHIIQSSGILVTTIATGYNKSEFIWLGISLNILASLFNVFEKTNNSMLNKLAVDIKTIKDGTFVMETPLIDEEDTKKERQIHALHTSL